MKKYSDPTVIENKDTTQPMASSFVVKTSQKSDEQIEEEIDLKSQKHLYSPTILRRVMATVTDLAMVILATLMLWAWAAQPIIQPYANALYEDYFTFEISSGLFVVRDAEIDGITGPNIVDLSIYFDTSLADEETEATWVPQQADIDLGYVHAADGLVRQMYAFYSEYLAKADGPIIAESYQFLNGDNVLYSRETRAIPDDYDILERSRVRDFLETDIHGEIADPKTYFTPEWFNYRFLGLPLTNASGNEVTYKSRSNPGLFDYKAPDKKNELAVINPSLFELDGTLSIANQNRLHTFLTGEKDAELSTDTLRISLTIFTELKFMSAVLNQLTWQQVLAAFVCLIVSFLVFMFIVPVSFPNGETLGMLVTKLILLNKTGYRISRWQTAARQLFFFVELALSIISIGILGVVCILILVFAKDNKCFHDKFAGTRLVDKDRSIWFNNKAEEQVYRETVRRDLELLRDADRKIDSPNRVYIK